MVDQGDEVAIRSGMFSGKTGEVVEIDDDRGIATVAVEGFGSERETRVPADDLEPVGGDVDELLERVEERVREAVGRDFEARRQIWWARRAQSGISASTDLLEEFDEFRAELEREFVVESGKVVEAVKEDLEGAGAEAIQRWLAAAADDLDREWRQRADERRRELLHEVAPDDELERMKREAIDEGASDGFLDDQAHEARAVKRVVSRLVDEGLDLWNTCEDLRAAEKGEESPPE